MRSRTHGPDCVRESSAPACGSRCRAVAAGVFACCDFLGECESTTADLLGGDNGDQRLAIDDAREFLEAELADGPRLADEITKAAAAGSISEMTLRRARKALGVRSKKQGFGAEGRWLWEMDLRRSTASGANPVITYAEIPISRDKALPD